MCRRGREGPMVGAPAGSARPPAWWAGPGRPTPPGALGLVDQGGETTVPPVEKRTYVRTLATPCALRSGAQKTRSGTGELVEGAVRHNAADMCGRFALYTPPARVARYFHATLAEGQESEHEASWNVAPTDEVLGVRDRPLKREATEGLGEKGDETREVERLLMTFRWGLIPWWSKDAKGGSRLINARRETVLTKSSFREAFEKRRIIVP